MSNSLRIASPQTNPALPATVVRSAPGQRQEATYLTEHPISGGSPGAISIANALGTLSIAPPNLTFTSTDGSTINNAVFSTNNTMESCAGRGKGSHVTCSYAFTGTFNGTLTANGSVQAINGTTKQIPGSPGSSVP